MYFKGILAEGMGFEPMGAISHPKRLAGARTRPLCDPSIHSTISKQPCYGKRRDGCHFQRYLLM